MKNVGDIIRSKREEKGMLLRQLAAQMDIDQAILSKIERGERTATKENVLKFAQILGLSSKELLVTYFSEKIAYEIAEEDCASEALRVAEKRVKYLKSSSSSKTSI